MNTNENDLNLANFQQILFQDDKSDAVKSANIQRKCLVHMTKASFKSLDNSTVCHLLDANLKKYSETVDSNGQNIYNSALKNLLGTDELKSRTANFQSRLDNDNIDVTTLIKPLNCSLPGKVNCATSEAFNEGEFAEFCQIFKGQKPFMKNKNQNLKKGKRVDIFAATTSKEICSRKQQEPYVRHNNFSSDFKSARDELDIQNMKKYGSNQYQARDQASSSNSNVAVGQKRKLGSRRNINSRFISPLLGNSGSSHEEIKSNEWPTVDVDERLKNIDPKMVELIKSEIMDCGPDIHWNDIAGLAFAKSAIQEAVVWPMLRPDIFTGLRRPPKGILLFGPPGTGKTLIGKCVASQSKSTFFSISASSLTSKWVGDGEKMVRALFTVARVHQPSVIFIDEIDSLLSQRSDTEHESSRRIKTEFLVQLDGATTDNEERILVIGATNRPQELDEAARRRFVKRLHIPLPEYEARLELLQKLMSKEKHQLGEEDLKRIANLSEGHSGADIRNLCSEASLGPIRSINMSQIEHIKATEVRPLFMEDFEKALSRVRPSVSPKDLEQYTKWDKTYGSGQGF